MSNPHYTNTLGALPYSLIRAQSYNSQFAAVETGFDSVTTELALKATIASPTFTGTVVLPSATSIGSVTAAELARLAGLTSNAQAQIDTKAPINNPTFTGTVSMPGTTSIGNVSATEIAHLDGVTSSIQTQLDSKAPLASPALTGTPTAPTAANGTNSTQIATTAFVAAGYAPLASPALTGAPTAPTAAFGTNTTQLSTTAFVQTAVLNAMGGTYPDQTANAGKSIVTDGSVVSWGYPDTVATTLVPTKGGTGQSTWALGDLLYGSGTNTLAKLAGSTVAAKRFLTQTGTGAVSAIPAWGTIAASDLPTVTVAKGGTNLTTIAARSIPVANSLDTYTTVTPGAGQSIRINAGNTAWEAYTPSTGDAVLSAGNAFTGANTFFNATGQTFGSTSTQDGIVIQGRAGGTTSLRVTLAPGTLTASRSVTFGDFAGTVVLDSAAQTLTNKTLTTPVLSATGAGTTAGQLGYSAGVVTFGNGSATRTVETLEDNQTITGVKTFAAASGITVATATVSQDGIVVAGRAGGTGTLRVTLQPGTLTANRAVTFGDLAGTVVLDTATQTLTNKTISLASNTVSGTTAQFNAALSDGDFATLAGAETLTSKTLTSPVITEAVTVTASGVAAARGNCYVLSGSSQTVTLPASPTAGDKLAVITRTGTGHVIARNGQNIMGLAEDMTIDLAEQGFWLIFSGAAHGWVIF